MSAVPHKASARRTGGAEWPPGWRTMPHGISAGRYIDPEFQKLEYEKLWSKVWQVAARVDEIPESQRLHDLRHRRSIGPVGESRSDSIKAYYNVCPHRGTALAQGSGRFEGGRIICPFHGWRWDVTGKNQFVLERQEFRGGQLRDSDVALKETQVRRVRRLCLHQLRSHPESFDDFIAPVRVPIEGSGDRRHAPLLVEINPHSVELEGGAGGVLRGLSRARHASAAGTRRPISSTATNRRTSSSFTGTSRTTRFRTGTGASTAARRRRWRADVR